MVAIGRQSLADGRLPRKFAEGREKDIRRCNACDDCIELLIRHKAVGCVTHEKEYNRALREIRQKEGELAAKRTWARRADEPSPLRASRRILGKHISVHSLRQAFAMAAIKVGWSAKDLATQIRHNTTAIALDMLRGGRVQLSGM